MAEGNSGRANEFKGFSMSRGRGLHVKGGEGDALSSGYGSGSVGGLQKIVRGRGHSFSPGWSPSEQFLREDVRTSTPVDDNVAIQHLTDMVGQLGEQIGNSIAARFFSSGLANCTNAHDTPLTDRPVTVPTQGPTQQNTTPVVVHAKTEREPVTLRGDGPDKYSVQEWIAMTKAHLRKQSYTTAEQADEIQGRLLGKARDVVQIALRSDDTLDVKQDPDLIYDILMRYFSQSSSSLPLQDFNTTLPKPKENPVDYWIRLNKAADTADEGLHRQGRKMENICGEVAQMFAKHCPDPQLSSIFKCKPVSEWTSRDIQLRVDEYQREWGVSATSQSFPQLKSHPAAVLDNGSNAFAHSDSRGMDPQSTFSHATSLMQTHNSFPDSACVQQHVQRPQRILPPQHVQRPQHVLPPLSAQRQDDGVLGRMMSMLERVLARVEPPNPERRQKRSSFFSSPPCRVCGDANHSTLSHCRSDHLCFKCLAPGHSRQDCPNIAPPELSPASGN
jgi:hypothetical protein